MSCLYADASPWPPFSAQKGFKPQESIISLFVGLGMQPSQGNKGGGVLVKPRYDEQFRDLLGSFTGLFGALIVCDPLVAKALYEQGYQDQQQLVDWIYRHTVHTVDEYKNESFVLTLDLPRAQKGIEPYASWFKLPDAAVIQRFAKPQDISIVVVGGQTQSRFQAGNLRYSTSLLVDQWR